MEYRVNIGNEAIMLPVREIKPGLSVALFDSFELSWKEKELLASALAEKIREEVGEFDVVLVPEAKAFVLAEHLVHALGFDCYVPLRKVPKSYWKEPISVISQSITSGDTKMCIDAAPLKQWKRRPKAIIFDDVISTGGSVFAAKECAAQAGIDVVGVFSVLQEGKKTSEYSVLGYIPIWLDGKETWNE